MSNRRSVWQGRLQSLGPGLLMAGAAIGGSHLVQSTRAGADYGFTLIWAIVLANLFKYPFFQFGPRYTAATGRNLLEGYERLGGWAIAVFAAFTLSTMFFIEAALVAVTAGLAGQMLGVSLSPPVWSAVVLLVCVAILGLGRYPVLDRLIKIIIVVLSASTVFAAADALLLGRSPSAYAPSPDVWSVAGLSFVVALMGWMPSIVDISVWHSLWSLEHRAQTGHRPTVAEAVFDFDLGFFGTAVLALAFLALGAVVMHGTGESFSESGVVFAGQLVSLYTARLGAWTAPIIVVAAFTTIFSSTLTVTDAYPRTLSEVVRLRFPRFHSKVGSDRLYLILMLTLVTVAWCIIAFFLSGVTSLVDLATTLSFLTTPVLCYINYRVMTDSRVPSHGQPGRGLRLLSWTGIAFWTIFAAVFLYVRAIS